MAFNNRMYQMFFIMDLLMQRKSIMRKIVFFKKIQLHSLCTYHWNIIINTTYYTVIHILVLILHIHINQNLPLLYGSYLKFLPHLLHCKRSIVVHLSDFFMVNPSNQELLIIRELLCQKKHKFMQIWPVNIK